MQSPLSGRRGCAERFSEAADGQCGGKYTLVLTFERAEDLHGVFQRCFGKATDALLCYIEEIAGINT